MIFLKIWCLAIGFPLIYFMRLKSVIETLLELDAGFLIIISFVVLVLTQQA
jgi:hypothetical protein